MTPDPARPPAAPLPWLVADIGGTNARFGWVATAGGAVQHVASLRCADHAGPAEAAAAYLAARRAPAAGAGAAAAAGAAGEADAPGPAWQPPRAAAFAVATAVDGDRVALTNSGWTFSRAAVAAALGLQHLAVLNDFEALALALPRLQPEQLRAVGPLGMPRLPAWPGSRSRAGRPATLAVVGPGTGLGVAALVPAGDGWLPVPGEGGHATLAAADDDEAALLATARRLLAADAAGAAAAAGSAGSADTAAAHRTPHRSPHLSAERLLSGIGLPLLYRAVAAQAGRPDAPPRDTPQIVQHALDGSDALCSATIDRFCALLGGFAGSLALTVGARGGLYIGGGIVPRLGERFAQSGFRERFEAKGRFRDYLAAIPTAVITDTDAALAGAAAALANRGTT
jgi:glucokinase